MDSGSGVGILLMKHAFALVYKDSTNFQDAHRNSEPEGFFDCVPNSFGLI
jgi:hypothetical protein